MSPHPTATQPSLKSLSSWSSPSLPPRITQSTTLFHLGVGKAGFIHYMPVGVGAEPYIP